MDTPGYDPVSLTGMVAGGANIIAFTTGRGSVFGEQIYKRILAVASGQKTKSEKLAMGDDEFVPWHIGVVL